MDRRTRTYRGISTRAAIGYLEGLGGRQTAETTVEGEGWRADLSAETVGVGPTLTLTEITVEFEGDAEALDPLIDAFSQKAMRAGG